MYGISQVNGRMEGGLTLMKDITRVLAAPKQLRRTRVVAHVWRIEALEYFQMSASGIKGVMPTNVPGGGFSQ